MARSAQSQQPPFRAPYQAPPRAAAAPTRGRGAHTASSGPRPGILKKPKPKLEQQQSQQQPVHQPSAPLPSWRSASPHPRASPSTRAGPSVQRPAAGNINRAQPVAQFLPKRDPSSTAYKIPPQSEVSTDNPVAAGRAVSDETVGFRIPSYGVASVKCTRGLCEVFGVLDSVPTASRQGLTKHFTLREERSSVNCIFYQMDRPLGQLKKGTLLRCVGFMNRAGQLSVVSTHDNAIILGSVYSLAECVEPLPDEEVRIQCPHCSYNCTNRAYLRRHIRVHTGEQPYHCTFCSRRFKDRSNLNRHRRCHTGERPYECEHCGLRFNQTSSLKTHCARTTQAVMTRSGVCIVCTLRDVLRVPTVNLLESF
ncbi:hypothetical protein HPB49_020762 [Dermacentor silvarum]|uniref:Uncharacterized protein n=1 Tax=Dermacentor silvarum TaxID=543639 RepID=A0ACB8DKJ2_DERSI|nr:hypothetical protein HPB49_020762 [Dermacentor silvarum]